MTESSLDFQRHKLDSIQSLIKTNTPIIAEGKAVEGELEVKNNLLTWLTEEKHLRK